jgi:hypothetical protein
MKKMTDREIRSALINHLSRRAVAPTKILEEVQVCNGNAIADVVAVYKTMHCYEIKGETDSINRIVRQGNFYDQAFRLITLVTTANHLRRAEAIAPSHWGIVLVSAANEIALNFKYIRGAQKNPHYRAEIALLSLWRSELLHVSFNQSESFAKLNREGLANKIATIKSNSDVDQIVGKVLSARARDGITSGSLEPYIQCVRKLSVLESSKE